MMNCRYFSQPRFARYFARNVELVFEVSRFGLLFQASCSQNMKYLRFFFPCSCLVSFYLAYPMQKEAETLCPLKSNRQPHWLPVVVLQII